jgi:uncharacterized membrane protein YoaK (UPF0700 family)
MNSSRCGSIACGEPPRGALSTEIRVTGAPGEWAPTSARVLVVAFPQQRMPRWRDPAINEKAAMLPACILAAIAGYADTVGYLKFGAFAGLMTGNTVLLGIALAGDEPSRGLHYGSIILAFFCGVVTSRILLRGHCPPAGALALAAAMLVLCTVYPAPFGAEILAFAMGAQNAAATRFGRVTLNTVFITGNLQKFGEGIVGLLLPGQGRHGEPPPGDVAIFGLVWLLYGVGAALGAVAQAWLAWPLLIPAAILPFVLLRSSGKPAP